MTTNGTEEPPHGYASLVDALRALARNEHNDHSLGADAADRIERLERELAAMERTVQGLLTSKSAPSAIAPNGTPLLYNVHCMWQQEHAGKHLDWDMQWRELLAAIDQCLVRVGYPNAAPQVNIGSENRSTLERAQNGQLAQPDAPAKGSAAIALSVDSVSPAGAAPVATPSTERRKCCITGFTTERPCDPERCGWPVAASTERNALPDPHAVWLALGGEGSGISERNVAERTLMSRQTGDSDR